MTLTSRDDSQPTILVADDTVASLQMTADFLEGYGFRVVVAQDGEEALDRAILVRPDIILLDVMMPRLDGFEACRRLKADARTVDIPVIFMTSLTDIASTVRGFQAGGVDYISKPLQVDEVLARIKTHLSLRAMQDSLRVQNSQLQQEVEARKRAEEELKHYRDHLEELVTLRTTELSTSNARLRQEIVERKEAEALLHETKQFLQAIIDNSMAIIYVKDLKGRYLLINRRYEELFHVDRNATGAFTDFDVFSPEQAAAFQANDREVATSRRVLQMEERAPHDDGLHTYVSVKCPLYDDSGQVYAVCGISTDITEHKRVEEQLRQSQKMEAIGRLAGGIAHDFNNLLTAINGYSGLGLRKLDPSHPVYSCLREILKSGERAAGLTKQLLAYSRKQVLEPRIWNLNLIISDMEEMLKRLIGEDIHLVTELAGNLGRVRVDRGQVEQIILNLIVNSRDAMPDGGTLKISTWQQDLRAEGIEHQNGSDTPAVPHVVLSVQDSGIGMTAEVQARLFEPFFTTKEVGRGTGLGLSVVYGIVQQSGGTIAVTSEPGKGTDFKVAFPVCIQVEEAEHERRAEDVLATQGHETILLVEDEESVRRFATTALEAQGYRVLQARNGSEALKLLETSKVPVDLVITDVVMPDMGGSALARHIRENAPSMPVLFISGYAGKSFGETFGTGEERFLEKPFGPSDLARKVHAALHAH